jgi:hypothetical protein
MDLEKIKSKIITIQNEQVILDCEVALLYDVKTKEVNQAIRNNPEKFPSGYVLTLTDSEKAEVVKTFDHLAKLKFSHAPVKGLTVRAIYMVATILKSPVAIERTIEIIETFAKVRELSRTIADLHNHDKEKQKSMLQKSGEIISDILCRDFEYSETETTVELNLAVFSVKHTIKRISKKE